MHRESKLWNKQHQQTRRTSPESSFSSKRPRTKSRYLFTAQRTNNRYIEGSDKTRSEKIMKTNTRAETNAMEHTCVKIKNNVTTATMQRLRTKERKTNATEQRGKKTNSYGQTYNKKCHPKRDSGLVRNDKQQPFQK